PALSGDGSVPCVTCHKPDEGWSLSSSISRGYPGISHWLNSQTILNTANLGKLFWDGHKLSLEAQAPSAAQGLSGNGKSDMMEQRLYQVPEYRKAFKAIFGSDRNMVKDSWRAIAAFERAMNTPETPFDQYMRGDKGALSADQVRGLKIFEGKGRCIMCHNGPLLTDEKYYNVGLPDQPQFWDDPIKQAGHRSQMYSRGQPEYMFRKTNTHPGVYLSTHLKQDIGKFRTAPLRHLEYTPPFMHNGMFDDLEAVIDFYNKGGDKDRTLRDYGIANKTKRLKKLDLTDGEKADLLAFLESLSGDEHLLPTPKLPAPAVMTATESTFSRK
ncbi:MAG: cytochrome-c peroxidase, partial [Rhodospirillaceae bacterium]|nr:cytochrome-c peroxidase [Rhodospirillaceae bacterium]